VGRETRQDGQRIWAKIRLEAGGHKKKEAVENTREKLGDSFPAGKTSLQTTISRVKYVTNKRENFGRKLWKHGKLRMNWKGNTRKISGTQSY